MVMTQVMDASPLYHYFTPHVSTFDARYLQGLRMDCVHVLCSSSGNRLQKQLHKWYGQVRVYSCMHAFSHAHQQARWQTKKEQI